MFSSFTNAFLGDSRAAPAAAALVALIVIGGLGYWVYRLAFASRLRPSGGGRGRAPRLGVVDVFGLDGQRQLVIVRRDNIEHLLLLGGPNDLVVESNIQRAANGRDAAKLDAAKSVAGPEAPGEAPAPIPAPPAVAPRPVPARQNPARPAAEEPIPLANAEVAPPPRPRAVPPPRPAYDAPSPDAPKPEPAKPFMSVEPSRPFMTVEPPRPVVAAEPAKPAVTVEPPKAVLAAEPPKLFPMAEPPKFLPMAEPPKLLAPSEPSRPVAPIDPVRPAEPPPSVKPVEPALGTEPVGNVAVEPPRKAPPRSFSATARPSLPPPITPLRARSGLETPPEPLKIAPAPVAPAEFRTPPAGEPPVAVQPAPEAARQSAPKIALMADSEATAAAKPKKEEAYYDLESLEAEMARLLGRDP